MLTVVNAVVCEAISKTPPFTLRRVRKRWQTPPSFFWIYLEIGNPSEQSYDVAFELWRGAEFQGASETELIPYSQGVDELQHAFEFEDLEPKSYTLVVLLNGMPAATIRLDFGHPEGLP